MGRPMVVNLLKAGFEVTVYNRSRAVVDELAAEGAHPASSVAEVAAQADIIHAALPTLESVESVFLGADGLIESAREGQIFIDHSTVSPDLSRRTAEAAQAKGAGLL